MISPDRLERYSDFVDPEKTGAPYDPKQGIDRLMGVLSPDPKGIVLAAMGSDWYGTVDQLKYSVFTFLKELGLPSNIWPIAKAATWQYCERVDRHKRLVDGSLVELGAVVKKVEDPSQILYSRSLAGAELAVPLVQQAIRFVSKAREYAETQQLTGKKPPNFDSMWRIIGSSHSRTDQRRPIAVWETLDFLVHNSGKYRLLDIHNGTHISKNRLSLILASLGYCGLLDYNSPSAEFEGHKVGGWSVYRTAEQVSLSNFAVDDLYQMVVGRIDNSYPRPKFTAVIDYIKEHPDSEYDYSELTKELSVHPSYVSVILSHLEGLGLLRRPDPKFKGGNTASSASANMLTHLFYELVCEPVGETACTLSPLPTSQWDKKEVAIYLQNYDEERSNKGGSEGGIDVRMSLLALFPSTSEEIKRSHLTDLYNGQTQRVLQKSSFSSHLRTLIELNEIEQTRPGFYRRVQR